MLKVECEMQDLDSNVFTRLLLFESQDSKSSGSGVRSSIMRRCIFHDVVSV